MEWLFERTIELAAWVAWILGLVFLVEALILLVRWLASWGAERDDLLLAQATQSAAFFVVCGLAVGLLACIDRYVFDVAEEESIVDNQ